MVNKRLMILTLVIFFSISSMASANVDQDVDQEVSKKDKQPQITLTKEQTEELDVLYTEILEKSKLLTSKYQEYGVITDEKKEKIDAKFDKHYSMIKENGYIMKWDKHKCKKYKHRKHNHE